MVTTATAGDQEGEADAEEGEEEEEDVDEEDIIMRFFQEIDQADKEQQEKEKKPAGPRPYFQDLAL